MKVIRKHFDIFRQECIRWVRFFGLKEWKINAVRRLDETLFEEERALGKCAADPQSRVADFVIDADWGEIRVTTELLELCAFHEVCELLLFKLAKMAEVQYSKAVVEEEVHVIVRKLENSIFLAYKRHKNKMEKSKE